MEILAPVMAVLLVIGVLGGGVTGCMYEYPRYTVYSSQMAGEAELAQARY